MYFADLHTHIIAGVDDGAEGTSQMYGLLDALYRDHVRMICCTPHYHPGYYGANSVQAWKGFLQLKQYAAKIYPDLQLYMGNELHYYQGCLAWLEDGSCRTLNGTRCVLMDFESDETCQTIEFAALSFLRSGYIPVLAHIERYRCFWKHSRVLRRLRDMGAVLQVNAASVIGGRCHQMTQKMLRHRLVDIIASDTHNLEHRPPLLTAAFHEVYQKYGDQYAAALFFHNPAAILMVREDEGERNHE